MKKKNYSVLIAIALIAILVVAMICMAVSKNNDDVTNPNENISGDVINSGEQIPENPESSVTPAVEANVERDSEGRKVNVSENINKEKMTFEHLDLTDISISYLEGESTFLANVKNNSEIDYPEGIYLTIKFLNENGGVISEIPLLTSSVKANGETNIRAKASVDFSNASTIEVDILEK
ncbi:MAG: hypothetical protein IJX99_09635 [Clostridia bacterium]|nr:hypothetical protein [Clostridia bacterium]